MSNVHVEVKVSRHGGWLVGVRYAGGGLFIWRRRATTLLRLRAVLAEAAKIIAKENKS